METFDRERFVYLALKFSGLMDDGTVKERDKFERENIDGTIYEKYFGEEIERSEITRRILKKYEEVKKYDLESIFLLGVSQNRTEYMLPLVEKSVVDNILENNYEFYDISSSTGREKGYYSRASKLYNNIKYNGTNILGMNDILGAFDNFEEKEYEKVTENEEKKFIELIKIFENVEIKQYIYGHDELRKSKFFTIEEMHHYTAKDIENDAMLKNDKVMQSIVNQYDKGLLAEAISIFTSKDNKRCAGIINGLWVLGIIKTKDNINGFQYNKTPEIPIMLAPIRWFSEEEYKIDYQTIKNYFGKYDLIREFCDSRLNPEKIEVKKRSVEGTFDAIRIWLLDLLEQKDEVIFPKDEFIERTKDFNESEKERTLRVIQYFHSDKKYKLKDEFGVVIEGFDVIKEFGNMLGITVEEDEKVKNY